MSAQQTQTAASMGDVWTWGRASPTPLATSATARTATLAPLGSQLPVGFPSEPALGEHQTPVTFKSVTKRRVWPALVLPWVLHMPQLSFELRASAVLSAVPTQLDLGHVYHTL